MADTQIFSICRCYFTDNYYSIITGKHYRYLDVTQFKHDYKEFLDVLSAEEVDRVINELKQEKRRRYNLIESSQTIIQHIKQHYHPLHQELYTLKEDYLDPSFVEIVRYSMSPTASVAGLIQMLHTCCAEKVYSFPVFTAGFCKQLLEEIDNYQQTGIPIGKPNTMNKYGLMLNELGLNEGFITPFRRKYLQPLAQLLFPECCGKGLDSHKSFTVQYELTGDTRLDLHYDNAEVTLNICLGKGFDDGSLFFGKMRTEPQTKADWTEVTHVVANGVFHRGQHKHGAMAVQDGVRVNMIIWMRSSSVRNQLCPMCNDIPVKVQVQDFGDGFTEDSVDVCKVL